MSFAIGDEIFTPKTKWTTNHVNFWTSMLVDNDRRAQLVKVSTLTDLRQMFCEWMRAFVTRNPDESLLERVWKCGEGCSRCSNDVVTSRSCTARFHSKQPMTPQVVAFLMLKFPQKISILKHPQQDNPQQELLLNPAATKEGNSNHSTADLPVVDLVAYANKCVAYLGTVPAVEWYAAMLSWVDRRTNQESQPWMNSRGYGDGLLFQILKELTFERFIAVGARESEIFKLRHGPETSFGLIQVIKTNIRVNRALTENAVVSRTPPSAKEKEKIRRQIDARLDSYY